MDDYIYSHDTSPDDLQHYGVKGMRWGVRRYQKKDGTLTKLGKKHKDAAMKGLYTGKEQYLAKANKYKEYTETNKRALEKSIALDKKTGETSWATQSLRDAYKATGRAYVNEMYHAKIYEKYITAYEKDTIKVGQDYVTEKLKTGRVKLTDSGIEKESNIIRDVTKEFEKEYAKEIKEFR